MLLDIVYVVIGLAGLFFGGEWLVKGASRVAASYGVSALVIGLTVVAFGTSMPELLVNLSAAFRGSTDMALGNVVGSNIANIGLILGLTGFILPIRVESSLVRREIPIMIAASLVVFGMALDGLFSQIEGMLLFAGFIAFTVFIYIQAMRERQEERENGQQPAQQGVEVNRMLEFGRLAAGIALLSVGAHFMTTGASSLARGFGVSELVIGVTLVAFGTSLPELAASVVASLRKENDIAVGNIVGSNIMNLLAVLGPTSIITPVAVNQEVLGFEVPVMIGFALLLALFAMVFPGIGARRPFTDTSRYQLARWESLILLGAYAGFIAITFS
jgi:cation:H+ antiporter